MTRQAISSDFADLKHIIDVSGMDVERLSDPAYRLDVQKKGFLIRSEYTHERHAGDMKKIYLVAEIEQKVVRFLRIDQEQEADASDEMFWYQPQLKEVYFSLPHADVGGLAVLPHVGRGGIATQMLHHAEQEVLKKGINYLFSFVVFSPVTNLPSLLFHEKYGFERVAVSLPHTLFGMQGYQSILYAKKLS